MESCSIDIQQQIKKREEYLSEQNLDNIDEIRQLIERIEKEISNIKIKIIKITKSFLSKVS